MNKLSPPSVEHTFSGHSDVVHSACFFPGQTKLCSVGADKNVYVWDLGTKRKLSHFVGHTKTIQTCDISPSGKIIATGSHDKTIRLWKTNEKHEEEDGIIFSGHSHYVRCVRFNNDGSLLFSTSHDGSIKIWNVERKKVLTLMNCHEGLGVMCVVPIDNRTLISGGNDFCVRMWDIRLSSEKCIHTFEDHNNYVLSVKYHPQTFKVASSSVDQTIRLYDIRTLRPLQTFEEHTDRVWDIDFHPSGTSLISGSDDETIKLFNLLERKIEFIFEEHFNTVCSVQFSPDGNYFASASWDGNVILWRSNFQTNVEEVEDETNEQEQREQRIKIVQVTKRKTKEENSEKKKKIKSGMVASKKKKIITKFPRIKESRECCTIL